MIVAGSLHAPGPIELRARTRTQMSLPRVRPVNLNERELGKVGFYSANPRVFPWNFVGPRLEMRNFRSNIENFGTNLL